MSKFRITENGYKKMRNKLSSLIDERPNIANEISSAREQGDLSENEEYASAKDKQKVLEAMIADLSNKLAEAEVVDITSIKIDYIDFGAKVELLDLNTDKKVHYQLLSEFESDLDNGILAIESLIGKSLVGKKKGDEVEIKTPSGIKEYEILQIKYE